MNWDDHRFFLAIARESSIRKAASTLGVSHSTVLRRITAFEDALDVRLFERLPTGYFTTPAGEDMLISAQRIEEEALAAGRRIAGRDTQLSGKVRVSMPGALVTHLLMPDIAVFARAHPEINMEITPTYSLADLARREADIAVRLSNDPPEDLVGRRVSHVAKAAYVSKDHLAGEGNGSEKLPLTWIGGVGQSPSPAWIEESDFPDVPLGTCIDDPLAQLEAAKAGVGMALLPCFMADVDPALTRMPPAKVQPHRDIWVLTHKDLRNTARVRKVLDFMVEALRKKRDLLEGKCRLA